MIDVGTAPSSFNVARIEVLPGHPQTMVVIGADTGAPDGPGRRVDIYEDVHVRGNLQVGELNCVRARLQQGVDGVIHAGVDDEVPRIEKFSADAKMHIIGGGPLFGPDRTVVLHDNVEVANDLLVDNDATVVGNTSLQMDATVGGNLTVNGVGYSIFNGSVAVTDHIATDMLVARNATVAAATFHFYDRGAGVVGRILDGNFGFNSGLWSTNTNAPWSGLAPVSMLVLDRPVMNPVVTITPWFVGLYDESVTTSPVMLAVGTVPPMLFPCITIKGEVPVGPMGTLPSVTGIVNQIEIIWAGLMGYFAPIANTDDLVFEIKVIGMVPLIL